MFRTDIIVSKLEELDKLDRAIKDAELRLKSIQNNIENTYKEINVLEPRKNELEANIEFHKKAETVPIAHEYKKSKQELSKVKSRLNLIKSEEKKAVQACIDIEAIIERFKNDYAKLLKTSENNILRPKFGGNRGKK